MAGLFVAINGTDAQIDGLRRDLEASKLKQKWLSAMVGSEQQFLSSLNSGEQWKPLLDVLPSTSGCTKLAVSCTKSESPLVRRAGLYWGYWVPTATYWKEVRRCTQEGDALTRGMAKHLLKRAAKNK